MTDIKRKIIETIKRDNEGKYRLSPVAKEILADALSLLFSQELAGETKLKMASIYQQAEQKLMVYMVREKLAASDAATIRAFGNFQNYVRRVFSDCYFLLDSYPSPSSDAKEGAKIDKFVHKLSLGIDGFFVLCGATGHQESVTIDDEVTCPVCLKKIVDTDLSAKPDDGPLRVDRAIGNRPKGTLVEAKDLLTSLLRSCLEQLEKTNDSDR